jgi:hypothetical protein
VVYYNPVVKQKWNDDGTIKYRVRGTAGGNLLDVPYDVSARTASLDVVKMLLHSTISDNKKWFTIDIKDFYLGTPLPETRYEYIRIERKKIPPASIAAHNLEPLFHNDAIYFQIRKCMYGLPQAGRLSQLRLISHLAKHGYHQCPNTPCLFRHETLDVTFCLVVDDFGIRYGSQSDADQAITKNKIDSIKEQIAVAEALVDAPQFLTEDQEVSVLINTETDMPMSVELPDKVVSKVTYSEPGLRGDTATRTLKPATVATGATVMVPLFVNEGDVIRINTKTGEYIERVKD